MNRRIAKKIEQAYFDGGEDSPYSRYWTSYTPEQRAEAERASDRHQARKAAAVRKKRGWAKPLGVALTSAKKGESVWVDMRASYTLNAGW